jgi:hypothetical protein
VDGALCPLVRFFRRALAAPEGVYVSILLIPLAFTALLVYALEGSRKVSSGLSQCVCFQLTVTSTRALDFSACWVHIQ